MTHSKSNRALSFVLSLLMILSLSTVFCFERAHAETEGAWQYVLNGGTVEITGYNGTDSTVSVPQKIAGKQVTSISGLYTNNAKTKAVSVILPAGLKTIGDNTFNGYSNLSRITLPDSLNTIGSGAFYGCTALTGISIPSQVTKIGSSAFADCLSLGTANLTSGVTELPDHLFDGCRKLSVLTLPLYITSIGDLAFSGCESLKSIIIPDGVKSIGVSAFDGCSSLASVTMPYELKSLGKTAFANCKNLKKVFIPNKTKTIAESAFRDCTSLTEVYFSPSISVIKEEVFVGCTNLEKVVFGGDYVNLNRVFDVASAPTIYYPVKCSSSWSGYTDEATRSYAGTSSVSVSGKTKLSIGEKTTLKVVVNPTSGSFSGIYSFSSSNLAVATVSPDGVVYAKSAGKATITVTDVNGTVGTLNITVSLAKPSNVKATPKSTSSIELKWDDAGAAGYYVYRSTSKSGTYKKVDTVIGTSFTDKGLTKGKTYYYKVVGYLKTNGTEIKSDESSVVSITVSAPIPSSVKATKTKSGVATIKWGKSTGATGYEVYMATSKSGSYSKIATVTSVNTLSYKKTGLKAGKTYYFKVRSYVTVSGKKVYSPYSTIVKVKV